MNIQSSTLDSAWDRTTGHAYVGIPDSGLDVGHPDFLTSFRNHFSYDAFSNDNDVNFDPTYGYAGHGQHVAGVIAADSNNGIGTSGICWDCSIMFARTDTSTSNVVESYSFLGKVGAQVINSSFTNRGIDTAFTCNASTENAPDCLALEVIAKRDIAHVAAAGNGNNQTPTSTPSNSTGRANFIQFPASDDRVIAVGATDSTGQRAGFSDYGPDLDLVAPGVNILSTFVRNFDWNTNWNCGDSQGVESEIGYGTCTGTSMSAPHVTGLAALIRSTDPLVNRSDVQNILEESGSEQVKHPQLGYGIPDANFAVEKTLGSVDGVVINNRLTPLFSFYS